MQDGSTPTIATPSRACATSRVVIASARRPASSRRPLEMAARPQQRLPTSSTSQPAISSSSTAAMPTPGSVKVVNEVGEHDDAAERRCLLFLSRVEPAQQGAPVEARQRPVARDAQRALQQCARTGQRREHVRQRRERGTEPVEPARRGEEARASRHTVFALVLVEELALHRRHVDAERALALARLAFQAEVEDVVQTLVAERRARIGLRQRVHQRVGAAARAVLLLARGHVRRAHDARRPLAADADVHAAVGRAAHPAGRRERQSRRQRWRRRQCEVTDVVGHRRRVDDLAGVEQRVRVEEALDLAHRLVQLVAEDGAVELAARQAVAVLAGVGPAELGDQVADLLRDGAHGGHLGRLGEVHERTDVQAADRCVSVEAGLQAVPVEDRRESPGVLGQVAGSTAVSSMNATGRRMPSPAAMSRPSPAERTLSSAAWCAGVVARSVW